MNSEQDVRSRLTRRDLLSTTLGLAAAGAASLSLPRDATAAGRPPQAEGRTYNGGADPYPIPWLDKFGSHNQAAGPNMEPSHIYHFKGLVARCNGFVGMGTDNKGNRIAFGAPSTDYGIMQGDYWAARAEQVGAYVHIWHTLFQGQVAPANEIHDFHPRIARSGLFWAVPIPQGGLTISPDGKTATIEMKNVVVRDEPKFPALNAVSMPATMSFKMVVQATDQKVVYDDPLKQFRVDGYLATAQLEAQVNVPSIGFSWKSDPLATSKANFAVIGNEVNGRYYTPAK